MDTSAHPYKTLLLIVGCVLLLNHQIYFTTMYRSIYLISQLWKLGLGLGLDFELHYFSIFNGE